MADPLRIGFIGANGRWGPRAHAPALASLPQVRIHAVCTAHADTAQAAAEKYGAARAYSDVKAMCADPEVEAALVSVRVPAHYELTKAALEAGKHVYCEWPLGKDTREAEELAELARRKNLKTMVGLQRRASPTWLYLRELVQDGYVGQVLSVHMAHMGSGVLTRPSNRTWQRDVTLGANPLTITFGHSMDALCMAASELAEVSAVVSTQVPQWYEHDTGRYVDVTSPDNVLLAGRLESGAVVSVHLGINPYHGSGFRLEIYGKEGTLVLVGGGEAGQEAQRRILGGRKDDAELKEMPVPDRFKWVPEAVRQSGAGYDVGQMWVKFAEAIRSGGSVEADFDHAVRRHRMLDAIRRASETGERQKLS